MDHRLGKATMIRIAPLAITALGFGLAGCTNPYDPVQRGLGGGVLGAASGAAIGAAAGGGPGAALGAAIGGATGIFGGVASTPPPPPGTYYGYPLYGYSPYGYPAYGYPGYGYPGHPASGYPGYWSAPGYAGPPGYAFEGGAGYLAGPGAPGQGYGLPGSSAPPTSFPSYEHQSPPLYAPGAGSTYGPPVYRGHPPEDWLPAPGHNGQPSAEYSS
jgi:hypothetical protein